MKHLQNLKGAKTLNKKEQQSINGGNEQEGGGCCNTVMYPDGYNYRLCDKTSSEAQLNVGQQVPGLPTGVYYSHWCCESC